MNVVLACDTLDRTNWGCRATSSALRHLIGEVGVVGTAIDYRAFRHRTYPGFRYLDATRSTDAALRVRAPWVRIGNTSDDVGRTVRRARSLVEWGMSSVPRARRSLEAGSLESFEATWERWTRDDVVRDWVDALRACDAVVVNGEGAVRRSSACGQFGFFLAWAAKEKLGKPVAIVNHMCDLSDPVMRSIAGAIYPLADSVVTRGLASYEVAAPLCRPGSVAVAPDAAFLHQPAPRPAWVAMASRPGYHAIYPSSTAGFDPTRPYVCLGGSALYQDGTSIDQRTLDWFAGLASSIRTRTQVLLLGHDYPDHALFSELSSRLALPFVGVQTPIPQVVDLLGHASAYVGGRWHSSVLAATGGTPVISLASNSGVKSRDQRDFVVAPAPTYSLSDLPSVEEVVDQLFAVLAEEDDLRSTGLERVADFARGTRINVGLLTELVGTARSAS